MLDPLTSMPPPKKKKISHTGEMGRRWYESGKYLNKKKTFEDFIACAERLVEGRYTSPDRLCIEGRSAGGLTMGAVVNMRPDLFKAAIMGVPFVDCLTTMLDPVRERVGWIRGVCLDVRWSVD